RDQADGEGRPGELVDLICERDVRDLRADERDALSEPEAAESGVVPQRRDVEREAGRPPTPASPPGCCDPRFVRQVSWFSSKPSKTMRPASSPMGRLSPVCLSDAVIHVHARARTASPPALLEEGVLVRIGRSTTTEEAERHRRPNLVPGARRDQDGILRLDFTDLAVELQRALTFEHDV